MSGAKINMKKWDKNHMSISDMYGEQPDPSEHGGGISVYLFVSFWLNTD